MDCLLPLSMESSFCIPMRASKRQTVRAECGSEKEHHSCFLHKENFLGYLRGG